MTGLSVGEVMGEVFLLATPERNGLIHDGTSVFRFDDISTGTLERTDGRLAIFSHIPVQTDETRGDNRGGGQADFDEGNILGGVLFPQIDSDNMPGPIAEIYQTGRDLKD